MILEWIVRFCWCKAKFQTIVQFQRFGGKRSHDSEVTAVLQYIRDGWPRDVPTEMVQYSKKKYDLTVQSGCVLCGSRTLVPFSLRKRLSDYLHATHACMVCIKSDAKGHFLWPRIDLNSEKLASGCEVSARESKDPLEIPLRNRLYHMIRGAESSRLRRFVSK